MGDAEVPLRSEHQQQREDGFSSIPFILLPVESTIVIMAELIMYSVLFDIITE